MDKITCDELLRRLRLIRDIRMSNIKKYHLDNKSEYVSDNIMYNTLCNLDDAELSIVDNNGKITWAKITHEKTNWVYNDLSAIDYYIFHKGEFRDCWDEENVKGNFIEPLGSIYYKDLLDPNFTDADIQHAEELTIRQHIEFLISYLKDVTEFNDDAIKNDIRENKKLKNALKDLSYIVFTEGDIDET